MSKKTLFCYQINILLCNLTFAPTPKRDIIQLRSDMDNYFQRQRLVEFFHNVSENKFLQNTSNAKANFTPLRNRKGT